MLDDVSPTSVFDGTSLKPLDDFLAEVNRACRGPVKLYRFTREDVLRDAPKLNELGVLRFAAHGLILRDEALTRRSTNLDPGGELMIGRAPPKIHPEQRIRWGERGDEEIVDAEDDELDESPTQDNFLSCEEDSDSSSSFSSEEDDAADIPGLPDRTNLRSLKECTRRPEQAADDQPRTEIFFSCLAYRLGKTLDELEAQHRRDLRRLDANGGTLREANNNFLVAMIDVWTDEIQKQSEASRSNGQDRGLPMYQDVVTAAEPEAVKPGWQAMDTGEVEAACRTLVQNGVLREMHGNKTTLSPLPLDITGEGESSSALQRGPVWTFGHAWNRGRASLFWDIHWPMHLQSGKMPEGERQQPDAVEEDGDPMDVDPTPQEDPEDAKVTHQQHTATPLQDMPPPRPVTEKRPRSRK
ncbi:hypothetical protein TOPH_04114 [Tolypocladium ophioglossoides CBS 100239]|uniref:Uncharacterized protein n=1 Tax=Tolypocladium ophioglossoides (strain CBS 100239) TaxID=1163406 RepID=A0A0L0NBA0_TOLOC|nr:hypothetical protein TOPH_04114 [Tolypocladium ophioglossoides CBS 100239]